MPKFFVRQIGFEGAQLDMVTISRFKASPKILEVLSCFMGKVGVPKDVCSYTLAGNSLL